MADNNENNRNINPLNKGLHTDNSPLDTPKGAYRFALNAVNESELGDSGFLGNEEANEICTSLTPGYLPIGKVYISKNEVIIFSVSPDNNISEIGILDNNCNYTVHVNDRDVTNPRDKLNFKVEHQIQATYRLRRGCERTVYFTDGLNPPRYYNFDKPGQFKRGVNWASSQFNLYKKIETFPTIDSIEVLDSSGALLPGSYTILVQHMDEDLNGTEFYELVKDINIYNDSLNKTFSDIEGSSNIFNEGSDAQPYRYGKTNKAIKISLDAVDRNFTYIRFAFAERTSGNGLISRVTYSEPISTFNPIFTYTGDNATSQGTIEEIELFNINSGIQTAKHIEQIDNMLILANVSGEQAKVCKLQKYASRIKTDCFIKDIILTSNKEAHNPKNPLVVHNGLSYQPGDMYSIGIVYLFEDYTTSPVFHIPGKSLEVDKSIIYSPGPNVYPMSNVGNSNASEVYLDNDMCGGDSFWGNDSEGNPLVNNNVRHHRLPTRDEIGIGFVERTNTTGNTVTYKRIELTIGGVVTKSDPSIPYVAKDFSIIVKYKRNLVEESFQDGIFPDSNIKPTIVQSNIFLNTDSITDIKLYYQEIGSSIQTEIPLINNESAEQDNGLTYKISISSVVENDISHIYTVPILGLKFSDIVLPPEDEIGKRVIGYQIVRQERRDVDKTVLDSAVVFPMQKAGRNVSTALLAPEFFEYPEGPASNCEGSTDPTYPVCYNISKRNIMLVTPGHKFMDKTYDGFTSIDQVGTFEREYVGRTAVSMQNVYDGTSATGDEDKKTDDDDGFSLRQGVRFTGVKYNKSGSNPLHINNENTRMYNLEAVNYSDTEDSQETLYNLSCDNKALILSSTKSGVDLTTYGPNRHQFPYVYIRKDNSTFYQNFRNNPYYLVDDEVFTADTCEVFGGDTYIAPLRYSNHIFGNAVAAIRRKKASIWALIGSIVIALVGIALAIFSGGSSLILAGGIIIALGAIATGVATVIEVEKFNEIYGEKWQANLDKTVFDFIYARLFVREHPQEGLEDYEPDPLYLSWADDTFRWFGDIVGDLWFETQLNISLRVPPTNMENNYLKPLKSYMNDQTSQLYNISQAEYISNNSIGSGRFHRYIDPDVGPNLPEEWFFIRKITKPDNSRGNGIVYSGISIPQVYLVNPDHYVTTGIKKYYAIPLEYDCCSKCTETFPHRLHYSNQSFQEEKSDNYRMFLPNNYKDIEGETGEITNIFRLYDNLYAHTEEALWRMSRKYQERVTDEIVSLIGTGSYFEVPPVKVIDDNTGSSAGTRHKWSSIKTPHGYYYISENERKIYQFLGKTLKPISEDGLSTWFKSNTEVQLDKEFLRVKGIEYPNRDNPSSPVGTGFISTYDSDKGRLIFTKKDMSISEEIYQNDTEFCIDGESIVLFPNFSQTLIDQSNEGWSYSGMENCRLKFFRDVVKTRTEIREVLTTLPNNADIIVHLDMSGSFNDTSREQIISAIDSWVTTYSSSNPDWTGNLYYSMQEPYPSQRCWRLLHFIRSGENIKTSGGTPINPTQISKNIVGVSFVNENLIGGFGTNICYHPLMTNPMGNYASDFTDDYNLHISNYNQLISEGGTFNALNYPIVYTDNDVVGSWTRGFLQHVLAALKGISYTSTEISSLIPNPFMSNGDWNILTDSLQGNNVYPDNGLENYGWRAVTNRGWDGSGVVITPDQFQQDMDAFLDGISSYQEVEVTITYTEREYRYVDGIIKPLDEFIKSNNSWTISYSLNNKSWTSWHSYMPNFYINVPEKFYSWTYGDSNLWKHNVVGKYQTYYDKLYPHIIDYVSIDNPTVTKTWESINLQTEARSYYKDLNEFVDERFITFNKAILYNTRQCSGELDLAVKDVELGGNDYLFNQISNVDKFQSIIDRTERDWFINGFRDIRVDYTKPMWKSTSQDLQNVYYIDKVLNTETLDYNKQWYELESFRDKYLAIRLIFDKFADKKLITNFSIETEDPSLH